MPVKLMQVQAAAKVLDVHENTLRRWVKTGYLHAVRLPSGVMRFDPDEVERLRKQMFRDAARATMERTAASRP